MTLPYRYADYTVRYMPPSDEATLLARTTQRRRGLARLGVRSIYGQRRTPIAEDVVVGIYRLHREERIACLAP